MIDLCRILRGKKVNLIHYGVRLWQYGGKEGVLWFLDLLELNSWNWHIPKLHPFSLQSWKYQCCIWLRQNEISHNKTQDRAFSRVVSAQVFKQINQASAPAHPAFVETSLDQHECVIDVKQREERCCILVLALGAVLNYVPRLSHCLQNFVYWEVK